MITHENGGLKTILEHFAPTTLIFALALFASAKFHIEARGGNRAGGPGRAGPGQQWAGPKSGRAKIGPVFSGQDFNSSARPKNRAGGAK